jgi:hypothetical protein
MYCSMADTDLLAGADGQLEDLVVASDDDQKALTEYGSSFGPGLV